MLDKILLIFAILVSLQFSFAQDLQSADSSVVIQKKKPAKTSYDYSNQDPKKATIYSAIIPGLGQAYNRRYWKIPLIYAIGGLFTHWTIQNSKRYDEYNRGLNFVQNPDNNTESYVIDGDILYESQLKQGNEEYKRQRNFNFILLLAIYGLQIVDASVDAHLLKFHNSENFLSFAPTVINHRNQYSPGLALSLNLR